MMGPMPDSTQLIRNEYQLKKFIKHTVPSSYASYKTVFTGVGSETYQAAIVNTLTSGCVERDNHNRMNFVWVGSISNGFAYQGGQIVGLTHGVKVVLAHDQKKLHAFPVHAGNLRMEICARCGNPAVV